MLYWRLVRPKTFGVKVLIFHNDEVLLIQTTYEKNYSFPGGGIKKGETPEEAARREAHEEVGIHLETLYPLPSFVAEHEYKIDTVYTFFAYVDKNDYLLDWLEIDMATWCPVNSLPALGPTATKSVNLFREHLYKK